VLPLCSPRLRKARHPYAAPPTSTGMRSFTSRRRRPFREVEDITEMIDHLFADLARWSASRRFTATGFTRIVMELADLPGHPARKIASRQKAALESWLEREFERRKIRLPEIRAREIVLLLEGATALMLVHANRDYAAAAAEAAKRLLRS